MKKIIKVGFLVVLILAFLGGCNKTTKKVSTDGSTSMEKVIGVLGEVFEMEHNEIAFTYNPTGSGAGITAVLDGRCDIGLSSRYLKTEEMERGVQGTLLAYDGIAVVVHKSNPVTELSMETIGKIFRGEIKNWSRVGGADAEIVPIGREVNSGTRMGFELAANVENQCNYRQELTASGDVLSAVSSNPYGIGYTSLASVKDTVNVILIDGVAPNYDTIQKGTYTMRRPFLLVTQNTKPLSETAQQFFDFCFTSDAKSWITKAGFVPAR